MSSTLLVAVVRVPVGPHVPQPGLQGNSWWYMCKTSAAGASSTKVTHLIHPGEAVEAAEYLILLLVSRFYP